MFRTLVKLISQNVDMGITDEKDDRKIETGEVIACWSLG